MHGAIIQYMGDLSTAQSVVFITIGLPVTLALVWILYNLHQFLDWKMRGHLDEFIMIGTIVGLVCLVGYLILFS